MLASLEGALATLMPKRVGKIQCPENFRKRFFRWLIAKHWAVAYLLSFYAVMRVKQAKSACCFIFCAFACPDGPVTWNTTGLWSGALLIEHGLMAAIQEVLHMTCAFTVEKSLAYTWHSPCHLLPEVVAITNTWRTWNMQVRKWKTDLFICVCVAVDVDWWISENSKDCKKVVSWKHYCSHKRWQQQAVAIVH